MARGTFGSARGWTRGTGERTRADGGSRVGPGLLRDTCAGRAVWCRFGECVVRDGMVRIDERLTWGGFTFRGGGNLWMGSDATFGDGRLSGARRGSFRGGLFPACGFARLTASGSAFFTVVSRWDCGFDEWASLSRSRVRGFLRGLVRARRSRVGRVTPGLTGLPSPRWDFSERVSFRSDFPRVGLGSWTVVGCRFGVALSNCFFSRAVSRPVLTAVCRSVLCRLRDNSRKRAASFMAICS